MAKMLPPHLHPDVPTSERKVFERLKADDGTGAWTVLHSLALGPECAHPFGEIDFVVLIPGEGIVCLEVKGGRIRCEEGTWYTRDRYDNERPLKKSPFLQVRDATFNLRSAAQQRMGSASEVARAIYSSAVVLPDTDADAVPPSPEFASWELIGRSQMEASLSECILRVVRKLGDELAGDRRGCAAPTHLKQLRQVLRPDFEAPVRTLSVMQRSEERIIRLTDEQYDALDAFDLNRRCVVEGAAGTGKTLLALEYARRQASEGVNVLLLCYNRLLGAWMQDVLADSSEAVRRSIRAGTYYSSLREVILGSSLAREFRDAERKLTDGGEDGRLFSEFYPLYGGLALTELADYPDLLILDEAQDLLATPSLGVFDTWLRGGLSGGQWILLGDFTRQSIYGLGHEQWAADLEEIAGSFARIPLKRNCRNSQTIGEETALLSGFDALPYRLDDGVSLPVTYAYWIDRENQTGRLRKTIKSLTAAGVPPGDIVVLSPFAYERSVAADLPTLITPFVDMGAPAPHGVRFSTIQGFKGLESPAVIISDIDSLDGARSQSLLYVGMSRARSHLTLLLKDGLQHHVASAIKRKLEHRGLQ